MERSNDRERAERALTSLREQLRDHPDVISTGLGLERSSLILKLVTRRYVDSLPTEVNMTPVRQEVREAPRPWRG